MDLRQRLTDDMKAAMKSGDKDRLSVIRMLLSDVQNIDLDPKKPTAEQAVSAYAKKLRKSLEEYEKLGKTAEVDKLKYEIGVAEGYLPKKASTEDTAKLEALRTAAATGTAAIEAGAYTEFREPGTLETYLSEISDGIVEPRKRRR